MTMTTQLVPLPLGVFPSAPAESADAIRAPLDAYLSRLGGPESRRVMLSSLNTIARAISGGTRDAASFPWAVLRYPHTAAIRAWLNERASPATASRDRCALRGILGECWRLGLLVGDDYRRAVDLAPIRGTALPRGRVLDHGELRALFAACAADPVRPRGARNACALALLYGCGLRRAEAVAVDLVDADPESGTVTVRLGKGRRARLVYLPAGGRAALGAWLAFRGGDPGPLLHPIRKGGGSNAIEPRRLSPQALAGMLDKVAGSAHLAEPASPHDLRRTFVSDLLDMGADLSAAQQLAGHSSPATTARYDRRGERAKQRAAQMLHVPFGG
jgi:integrase